MGVCGAAQICRGDNNPKNASNMQPRPKSLSSAKDVGFEHDQRHKTQSDSESSIICDTNIHPPMNVRQSHSHHAVDSSNSHSDSDHILKNNTNISNIKNPSILHNKSRNSHQMGSTPPAPSTTVLNPPKVGISVRKSKKYIPLPDNPPSPKISINPKVTATRSNPVFTRERNVMVTSRERAYSAELIKEAEHALLEDSAINNKMNTDTNVTPWLVTPVATPSNNIINKISYHNIKDTTVRNSNSGPGSPIYPLDFADENKGKIIIRPGPMNHLTNTAPMNSVPSQSSATPSKNRYNRYTNKMMNGDDININNIYTVTREPNLSMSMGPNLLAAPNNNQFPRISSTSSDFTHLIEQDRQRNISQGKQNDNIFDEHEQIDINWRFSHGGSMTDRQCINNLNNTNTAGSSTFNSSSNVPIDRVENGSMHSLTDL